MQPAKVQVVDFDHRFFESPNWRFLRDRLQDNLGQSNE